MYSQNDNSRRTHKLKHNTYSDKTAQSISSMSQKITEINNTVVNKINTDDLQPHLNSLYDQMLEQVGDRDKALECFVKQLFNCYAVRPILTAHAPSADFAMDDGEVLVVPLQTLVDNHSDYHFDGAGVVTPKRKGWYSVYAHCYDDYAQAAATYNLHILGTGSIGIVNMHIGNRPFQLYGHQFVYCDGVTDTICMALSHNYAGVLTFNLTVGHQHKSYMTISYVGDQYSAYVV